MASRGPTDVQELIAHAAGLRRLAVRLVGENDADDVLQDAVLAGIDGAPTESHALRHWLVRVVRNLSVSRHRVDGHRADRERAAARPESQRSTGELVERMEVQRIVAEEVLQLAEPYRTAVLALHFEGDSAEDYARRIGVPGATVRSWSKRGLDTLRTRLDKRFGGERSAWSACLLSLARPENVLVPVVIAGGLMLKYVLAASAAILIAALAFWSRTASETPGRSSEVVAEAVLLDPVDSLPRTGAPEMAAVERADSRSEIAVSVPSSTASVVHGRVVWLPDREPAAGIGVRISTPDRPDLGEPKFVETDAQGRFRVDEVGSGEFEVGLDRAPTMKRLRFSPGETREVEFELQRAPKVVGRVLDAAGVAVADAEVCVVSNLDRWARQVTRSAADGSYMVEGVSSGFLVYARARGRSPSGRYQMREFLDLWLGGSPGAIEGRITDATGSALPGIAIAARCSSETITDPNGTRSDASMAANASTDADGGFGLHDLRPGRYVLDVHSMHRTKVSVVVEVRPGRTSRTDIALPATARLLGRVTDTKGEPCGGSHVQVSRVDGTTASSWILSDADGRYDTGFVPAGRVQLAVRHGRGKLQLETDLAPGEERDWSPVLGATGPIRGRVVDRAGRPLAGVPISNGDSSTKNQVSTDTSGRFELIAKLGQGASIAAWQGDYVGARCFAWPGYPEIELVFEAPSARILGRIVDPSGTPARGVALWCDRFGVIQLDSEGRFETGLLASGSHSLSVTPYGVGRCHLVTIELQPVETRDVGDLVLPGLGTLVVALHPHGDVDPQRVQILGYRLGSPEQVVVSNGANRGGDWTAEGLPEGEYRIHLSGGGAALMENRCTVRTGETTLVDVDAHFGNPVRVDVRGERLTELALEVRDEMGEIVGRRDLYEYDVERILRLRPGRYEIAVKARDGRTAATRVEVAAEAASEQVVRIDVR